MALSIYLGRSLTEWLQLFNAVKAEQLAAANGDRFISVGTGGKSYSRRVRSMAEIKADYGECLQALQVLDPDTYGAPNAKVNTCFSGWQPK